MVAVAEQTNPNETKCNKDSKSIYKMDVRDNRRTKSFYWCPDNYDFDDNFRKIAIISINFGLRIYPGLVRHLRDGLIKFYITYILQTTKML